MNCCDEYGNCVQGRNCPVRKKMLEEGKIPHNPVVVLLILATLLCALAIIILFVRT